MKRLAIALIFAATPAAAQQIPMSFESGKTLPLTPGQWSYIPTATGSESRYGAQLVMRCDRINRTLTIERPGVAAPLAIATSAATRTLPVGGRLFARDSLLDAIAFSRGRFLVSGGAGPVLAVPSWPEAARSIEDCRN